MVLQLPPHFSSLIGHLSFTVDLLLETDFVLHQLLHIEFCMALSQKQAPIWDDSNDPVRQDGEELVVGHRSIRAISCKGG